MRSIIRAIQSFSTTSGRHIPIPLISRTHHRLHYSLPSVSPLYRSFPFTSKSSTSFFDNMGTTETPTPPPTNPAKSNFMAAFDDVVDILISDISSQFDLSPQSLAYLRNVITYNVPHGKLNRGLAVFQCFKAFQSQTVSVEDEYRANLLGWCVELLQAFFLVADDIMDDSHTRRGQPCFFRVPEIGLNAINDSLILETMIYRLLHVKFSDSPQYNRLVALFRDIAYTTEIGQLLDLTSQPKDRLDLSLFTEDALARIYRYKTSHYTFYLPVALGMVLADVTDPKFFETAKTILLQMGHYFQAQDDFLDAFGDPSVTGKVGTDIEDKTCTWLIVEALKVATPEDKNLLQKNYGLKDPEAVKRVKDLYRRLQLPEAFAKFEQDSYDSLRSSIDAVDHMPTGAFEFLLAKIYKRDK